MDRVRPPCALWLLTACLLLAGCPESQPSPAQQAANQAALAPRAAQLPPGWPVNAFMPPAGLQQLKLTPQVLAAIEGRSGSAPQASADGYSIERVPFKEGREDDALVGLSGAATATDARDATDRARPTRKGEYWLIALETPADWYKLVNEVDAQLTSSGMRRIEGSEGPEGELVRWIDADETELAVLAHRTPRDDHREFGLRSELLLMACTLEKRAERDAGTD
jgi:hypothetical protein